MNKIRTEMVIKRIGTLLLVGMLLLGVALSGVFASDMPEEETIPDEAAEAEAPDDIEAQQELEAAEAQGEPEAAQESDEAAAAFAATEADDNRISGVIWLDQNEDGIMDAEEPGIGGFPVSLYQDDQIIDMVETDANGGYRFEQLEPGDYVIGIQSEIINETEYLIPLCGISGDNKFILTELADGDAVVLSDPVKVTTDTQVEDMNAGMRLPLEIMPTDGTGAYIVKVITGTTAGVENVYNSLADAVAACPDGEESVITVTQDDTISSCVTISDQKIITLTSSASDPWTITSTARSTISTVITQRHLNVTDDSVLILEDITLAGQGLDATQDDYNGGLYINGATAKMNSGATIQACSNGSGGGVSVRSGTFEMAGGEVSSNSATLSGGGGGGVHVNNSTFEMVGGKISSNSATLSGGGGGVYVNNNSTFEMKDGEISGNLGGRSGGGGVYVSNNSTFEMAGGEIIDNSADSRGGGGVYIFSGIFEMADGEIIDNSAYYGGGVYIYNDATFEMEGGKISNNTTDYGGGVYIDYNSTFEMEGGEVSDNSASYGGGVYVERGTFEMAEGEVIDNSASYGGGVYIEYNGTFEMVGGEVSDNSAGLFGGGVYIDSGTFEMMGGEVSDNLTERGGGVYIDSGTFEMSDGEVSDNFANYGGGGVYIDGGTFGVKGGEISGNSVTYYGGGGVYIDSGTFEMKDGLLIGNTAVDGGGIYTADYSYNNPAGSTNYSNIKIDTAATVQGNTADETNVLPVDYADFTAFPGELLNNDEINYKGPYLITYYDNDSGGEKTQNAFLGTGNVEVTLLTASGAGFTAPTGYELKEWNTEADGSGTSYVPGGTTGISESLTLYAIWRLPGYEITEEYYDDAGKQIQPDTTESVAAGEDYQKTAPVLAGYRYLGYQLDGGGMIQTGAVVTISNVADNHTVTFVYEEYSEEIHISVPVKLLWASFKSDDGDVTSPEYYFHNHSTHDISVTLQELSITEPDGLNLVESTTAKTGADEVALQLDPINSAQSGWQTTSQISLMAGSSGGLLGKIKADSQGVFDITGTYGGYFNGFDLDQEKYLQPEYNATFKFELTH